MSRKNRLKSWKIVGEKAELTYSDNTRIFVKKTDFDRAFGCVIALSKEEAERDFAIK